jgi:peptide deformylase
MKIVQAPEPVLSQKAKPVEKIDKYIKNLLRDMEVTLDSAKDPEGVGLAAPQVGKSLQLFILRQSPKAPLMSFINPEIISFTDAEPTDKEKEQEKKTGVQLEGCLSLYNVWGVVKRHSTVEVAYMDETGDKHTKTFDGFTATIIQHEFDHLQGILFPKRVLEQKNPLYRSVRNKKGEIEFEEIEI